MKKEMTSKTTDVWEPEEADASPFSSIVLVVEGNGTKLSTCAINFVPPGGGELSIGPGFVLTDISKLKELIGQLNIVSAQWEERLGNAKRG